MVLELQGRDETKITRILDRVAGDEDPPTMRDPDCRPRVARRAARPPRSALQAEAAGPAMSPKLPALKVAIVGHTNTGKTSLVRTLTRDAGFGEVSDRPATTRHVEGTVLLVDGRPLVELYDTPGLEDPIGLLEQLDRMRGDRRQRLDRRHPTSSSTARPRTTGYARRPRRSGRCWRATSRSTSSTRATGCSASIATSWKSSAAAPGR